MKRENEISEELSKMGSPLAFLSRTMPYFVPQGYFGNFSNELQNILNDSGNADPVPGWSKEMPHPVPAHYFEELTGNIIAMTAASEPVLHFSKGLPYSTPPGYFEQLPAQMLAAAKAGDTPKKETKIISLKREAFILPRRWAAAAIILITIGLGSYGFFHTSSPNPEKILASVPANDIQDYLQGSVRVDVDRIVGGTEINNLPLENKEIIEYLNDSGWD